MRLLVTSDLHLDVPRSRASALAVAGQINGIDGDAVLVLGDAATSDGDALEEILSAFDDRRPRLYLPGNHDLWSKAGTDALALLDEELPRRVTAVGWHWLPGRPFVRAGTAVVGSAGWYDYGYAWPGLGLPRRFYEAGLSPAAARLLERPDLEPDADDVGTVGRTFVARWNDKRRINLGLTDDAFCDRLTGQLRGDLEAVSGAARVVAGVHQVPLAELLPRVPAGPVPPRRLKYAFARAFLGSPRFGEVAASFADVTHVLCGHSHVPATATGPAGRRFINVGSDYESKRYVTLDV